jgi:hypothetical protein
LKPSVGYHTKVWFFFIFFKHFHLKRLYKRFVFENISVYYMKIIKKKLLLDTFFISKSMPWHFYCTEKPFSKIMKTVIDFLNILPDSAPFPNFVGEKIFNRKAYLKKNQVDWWGTTSSFLSSYVTILEDREIRKFTKNYGLIYGLKEHLNTFKKCLRS